MLTVEQKAEADRLLLTHTEMAHALKSHTPPEVWARNKQEMQAERDAWEAKLEGMNAAMMTRARYFAPDGRGERPWPKETDEDSSEDGGQPCVKGDRQGRP